MQEDYSFLLDPAYFPSSPIEMPLMPNQFVEMSNVSACFSHGCTPDAIPELSTDAKDKIQMQSHSSAVVGHHVDDKGIKKRKKRRQKRPIDGEEAPKGYVHLRTRRGQATDSHSLAERVRREKISDRMKILQGLVPGCDKVVGKALILDEIINYIKYMQNQMEFLSMNLATMNTVFNDFGVNSDYCMNQTERLGMMSQQLPFEHQISFHQTTAFDLDNCSMMNSSSTLPAKRQRTTVFTQDNEAFLMQVGEHREGFLKDNISFQ